MGRSCTIKVLVLVDWSVGHVVRSTLRDIFHRIRVVGLRYIVHKRRKLLGIFAKVFLISMQLWRIDKQAIKHLSLRWMISFLIK